MYVKLFHKKTGLSVVINNDNHQLNFKGDEVLIDAIKDYLKVLDHSIINKGDILSSKEFYGDLVIHHGAGKLCSIDTAADRYILDFFIPSFTDMGYECTIIKDFNG